MSGVDDILLVQGGPDDLTDNALRQILARAPDRGALPDWQLRQTILQRAHEAVADQEALLRAAREPTSWRQARAWWRRSGWRVVALGGVGMAAVLVAGMAALTWLRGPGVEAGRTALRHSSSETAPPMRTPIPAPVPAMTPMPAPEPSPGPLASSPPPASGAPASATSPAAVAEAASLAPSVTRLPEIAPGPVAAIKAPASPDTGRDDVLAASPPAVPPMPSTPLAPAAPSSHGASTEARQGGRLADAPPAPLARLAPAVPGATRTIAAASTTAPAAAPAPASAPLLTTVPPAPPARPGQRTDETPPPTFAALSQWTELHITYGGESRTVQRAQARDLGLLLTSAAIIAVGPQRLRGRAPWRVTLQRGGRTLATLNVAQGQVQWTEENAPPATGVPPPGALDALRAALDTAVQAPAASAAPEALPLADRLERALAQSPPAPANGAEAPR